MLSAVFYILSWLLAIVVIITTGNKCEDNCLLLLYNVAHSHLSNTFDHLGIESQSNIHLVVAKNEDNHHERERPDIHHPCSIALSRSVLALCLLYERYISKITTSQ